MKRSSSSRTWAVALLATLVSVNASGADSVRFEIGPQLLGEALKALADQADLQIIFTPESVTALHAQGISGEMSPEAALRTLLAGTNLQFVRTGNVVVVRDFGAEGAQTTTVGAMVEQLRLAQSSALGVRQQSSGAAQEQRPGEQPASASGQQDINEVIVTAQKRSERLQDVPVPVTAISGETLMQTHQLRLMDYFSSMPGLSVMLDDYGQPEISMRGLTTGPFTNPTVGIMIDGVPYGASTSQGFGGQVPDFDPSDLARIEELRGPQGTLYGAASLGGLLNYVTVDPSTDGVSGRLSSGITSVRNGAELGYELRGAVNLPLSDSAAVRVSAFGRQDPGYIDNPVLNDEGINEGSVRGGHLAFLWKKSDALAVKLSAMLQRTELDGASNIVSGLGDLEQNFVRGAGVTDIHMQAYSATVTAKLGPMDLTSVTGYGENRQSISLDYTNLLGALSLSRFGASGTTIHYDVVTQKFTQELRLSGLIGERFEWLLGGFYNHEDNASYNGDINVVDSNTGVALNTWGHLYYPGGLNEYAAFANLTLRMTDRFDVQFGARQSTLRLTRGQTVTGVYAPVFLRTPSPAILDDIEADNDSFTYLVTPRFKVSADLMVYARLASGFRPGGINLVASDVVPRVYDPDTTTNYEVGIKGSLLDRRFTYDASVYYIDWKDIQLLLLDPATGYSYRANESRAKSQGVELSVETRPLRGLSIVGWISWNEAELSEPFPATSTLRGRVGDRLPFAPRFSGNLAVDQDFPLSGGAIGFVGASVSYFGDRLGQFRGVTVRQDLPAYTRTDLRAGVRYNSWSYNVFANNLLDKRGLLEGGLGTFNPAVYRYIQPRTIGFSVSKIF